MNNNSFLKINSDGDLTQGGAAVSSYPRGKPLGLEVSAALRDPALRASALRRGVLPVKVAQALRMLDDSDFKEAAAVTRALNARRASGEAGPEAAVLERRRTLFRSLQERFPEVLGALKAARTSHGCAHLGGGKGPQVSQALQDVVILIMGEVSENPFAALDLAD